MPAVKKNASDGMTIFVSVPPDGGFGWLIVFASFWVAFITDGCLMMFAIYVPVMQQDMKVSRMQLMIINSVQIGVYMLAGPYISLLIQLLGFRFVSFVGLAITLLGYLITSFTQNYTLTVFAYGIMGGIGSGMAFTPSMIVLSLYFERYRAIATGIVYCGSSLGALSLTYAFQAILDTFGRPFAHQIQAALMALICVCVFAFRLPEMVEVTIEEEDRQGGRGVSNQSKLSLAMSMREFNSVYHPVTSKVVNTARWWQCCKRDEPDIYRMGPMDRQDLFFSGSRAGLNQMQSRHSRDVSKSPSSRVNVIEKEHRCQCCSYIMLMLARLIDVQLFKSPTFCVMMTAMFFGMLGMYTPFLFITDRALTHNIPEELSKQLLPIISIGSTIGRITAGLSSFVPKLEPTKMTALFTIVAGVLTLLSDTFETHAFQTAYALCFGFCMAFSIVLRSSMYVAYMGLERLTSVYGLGSMCMGFAALAGTPAARMFENIFGGYTAPFAFSGGCHIISGCLLLLLQSVFVWERRYCR